MVSISIERGREVLMQHCIVCYPSRNEIASCSEKAYTSLPLADAGTLLFFTNMADILNFAQEVRVALRCVLKKHVATRTQGMVLKYKLSNWTFYRETGRSTLLSRRRTSIRMRTKRSTFPQSRSSSRQCSMLETWIVSFKGEPGSVPS